MEKELIRQTKRNNKSAANELVSMYYKEIYTYVYKQTLDKELSMDLNQEIFISMLKSINTFDEKKSSFKTWLYKIATYKIVDYYRSKYYKHNNVSIPIEDVEIHDEEDISVIIEYRNDGEKVMNIIKEFDSLNQQIFRLKVFGEYTFQEISKILQMPESTTKTKYYSIVKKIKSLWEE
jgi:RNA polymerase sigma factor (sigma-70 family)